MTEETSTDTAVEADGQQEAELLALPRNLRLPLGLLAGLLICAAMPPWGWWPLAPIGIALWAFLLRRCPPRARYATGAMVGLGWFLPSTLWMFDLTVAGWPVGVMLWFPFVCGIVSIAASPRNPAPGLLGAIIISEWVRWRAPFGGVPLSVLAMSQGEGPLLPVARIASTLGVCAAVAAAGVGLFLLTQTETRRAGALVMAAVIATSAVGAVAPKGEPIREISVAAIQGGGEQRTLDAETNYFEVLSKHIDLAQQVEEGTDLILFPENITNVGGDFAASTESVLVSDFAKSKGSTVVIGIVEGRNSTENFWNAAVAYEPTGEAVARYDKVQRVPFGEYVPLRGLIEWADNGLLPGRDAFAGEDPAVLKVEDATLGVVVSWEVFFPRRVREAENNGAQIILNPTNGSSYWLTQVQTQQIASSQLRAVESGRWLIQAAPTGFSAIIDPDGNLLQRSGISEPAVLTADVQLRDGSTIAAKVGDLPALMLAFVLLVVSVASDRRRSTRKSRDSEGPGGETITPT